MLSTYRIDNTSKLRSPFESERNNSMTQIISKSRLFLYSHVTTALGDIVIISKF